MISAAPAAWLVYRDGGSQHAVPLTAPGVTIGRDAQHCQVVLTDFGISRVHARIHVAESGRMVLVDLKSKGGSQVNGVPVFEAPIAVGDALLLGQCRFLIAASATATMPPLPVVPAAVSPATENVASNRSPPPTTHQQALRWTEALCIRLAADHDAARIDGHLHLGRIHVDSQGQLRIDAAPPDVPLLGESPEQLLGGPADKRSDVFAAAGIAYEWITGQRPYDGSTLHAQMYRILHEAPPTRPPMSRVWPRGS